MIKLRICIIIIFLFKISYQLDSRNKNLFDESQFLTDILSEDLKNYDRYKRDSNIVISKETEESDKLISSIAESITKEDIKEKDKKQTSQAELFDGQEKFDRSDIDLSDPDNLQEYALDSGKDYSMTGDNIQQGVQYSSGGSYSSNQNSQGTDGRFDLTDEALDYKDYGSIQDGVSSQISENQISADYYHPLGGGDGYRETGYQKIVSKPVLSDEELGQKISQPSNPENTLKPKLPYSETQPQVTPYVGYRYHPSIQPTPQHFGRPGPNPNTNSRYNSGRPSNNNHQMQNGGPLPYPKPHMNHPPPRPYIPQPKIPTGMLHPYNNRKVQGPSSTGNRPNSNMKNNGANSNKNLPGTNGITEITLNGKPATGTNHPTMFDDSVKFDSNSPDETVIEVVVDCSSCGVTCPESCEKVVNNTTAVVNQYCCANSILTTPNLCPPCPYIDTSNCPYGGDEYDKYNEMYYIVDVGLKQPYTQELSDVGSKEFQQIRQMCQSFLLRIYHDHPYYHETLVKSIRNSKEYSIVTMLIRFTKQNDGNIKPFYKAIVCKCGCEYFLNDLFFKLAPANGTDLRDFCPASCFQQGSSQCETNNDCHGCCHGLPTGNYFLQKIPSPFMQEMLSPMVGMGMPQYPDIMCPGTCSPLCAPICSEECCTTAIGFKRTLSAYHRNNRKMEPNVLKNKLT